MADVPQVNHEMVKQMRSVLMDGTKAYETVRFQMLIHHVQHLPPGQDEWRLLHGRVMAIERGTSQGAPILQDYGAFVYEELSRSPQEALKWLKSLLLEFKCVVNDQVLAVRQPVSFSQKYATPREYTPVSYPCFWYQTRLNDIGSHKDAELLSPNLPPYPDMKMLMHHRFGVGERADSGAMGELHIFLPYYGARIETVDVRARSVRCVVKINQGSVGGYRLRLWARRGRDHFFDETDVKRDKIAFKLPAAPTHAALFLMDQASNTLVDHWGSSWQEITTHEKEPITANDWMKRILEEGEGQEMEWKNYADPRSGPHPSEVAKIDPNDLATEMVAFANTNDGVILVGVSDEGIPLGVDDVKRTKAKIVDVAHGNCDPAITPRVFTIKFGKKIVVGIEVRHGSGVHQTNRHVA